MTIAVTELHRFPVKSCRGESVISATVEPWGLAGDRRWMVVDADGVVITAREVHRMLLVRPELTGDGLTLAGPDIAPLHVSTPDGTDLVAVEVWGDRLSAAPAGPAADAWFTQVIGRTARLVHLDDPTRRRPDPDRTRPEDRVSFADGFPLLLVTEDSVAALNDLIAEGPRADEGPLPVLRFRPNVVVRGAPAWSEDGWRRIRIGAARFRMVKACDRCVLTTLDPQTGAKGMEPITTLARHRRWGGKTWFGLNLVPDTEDVDIRVGDEVEVLSGVDPGEGPLR